jgi:YHS domain-containing protein
MVKKQKKSKKQVELDEDIDTRDLYAAEEQGILPKETHEQLIDDIKVGEHEIDPLTSEGRETLVEDDEMEPWEAGFAEGASDEGQLGKDALTGEPLIDEEEVVEAEINGKIYRFVSEENAKKFREKHEIER